MSDERYNTGAIVFHWLMGLLILLMLVLGFYMEDLPKGSPERSFFFTLHKNIGMTLGLLAIARLTWRITFTSPKPPDYVQGIHRLASTAIHHMLYLFMFIQPLTGYISSSFSGYKTKFWGMPLPHWGWKSPMLNELFTTIHQISAYCLISLLILHIAGVFYHIYKGHADLMKRIWFS